MIRLLHLGDVHLGASFSAFGELAGERRSALLAEFRRLPELAAEEGADAVLVAGDLFEAPRPGAELVAAARQTLLALREAGVPAFLVPGNHDALYLDPRPYEELSEVATVFREPEIRGESVRCEAGELHVYGLAYDRAREPDPLRSFRRLDRPGAHVLLLHGSVIEAPHWRGGESLEIDPGRLGELTVDYIALGDHHRFRPPAEFGSWDGPDGEGSVPACYCGSFAALDLTEAGVHGAVLVEVEPGETPRVRRLPSRLRPVQELGEIRVDGLASETQVADAVAARVEGDAVPVATLSGQPSFPLDVDRVRSELSERFGQVRLLDDTRFYASERIGELAERPTVAGQVARLGAERADAAADEVERRVHERALRIALRALDVV